MSDDLIARLRVASHDERLATGMLYREAADEIERLRRDKLNLAESLKWWQEKHRELLAAYWEARNGATRDE